MEVESAVLEEVPELHANKVAVANAIAK